MFGLIKYNYKVYIKNNKFIIPLAAFCLFQYIYYSNGKEEFQPAITFGASTTFCAMIWMGFLFCELQDSRTEELIFLKVNNNMMYWGSKIIFMVSISFLTSILGTIWPSIKATEGQNLKNILFGFVLQFLASILGVMLGMILQRKVTGNKNRSILLLFFCALVSMIKMPILKEAAFLKYIMWILPPVSDITFGCCKGGNFTVDMILMPIIYCCIYIVFEIIIYFKVMKKILF